jgi:hypothetical protein
MRTLLLPVSFICAVGLGRFHSRAPGRPTDSAPPAQDAKWPSPAVDTDYFLADYSKRFREGRATATENHE